MNQPGRVDYQRYMLFDNTQVLSDLLNTIDAAKNDPTVAGIAINTSDLEINPRKLLEFRDNEKLWELREKLKDFKTSGKKVFIFIDNSNIDLYHFASVADKVVMDPFGILMLEGYIFGQTYYKGTLEKLGIGFDEWRFFKYKSAMEIFSQEKMSDADREQWQKIINGWHKIAKDDICEARHLTAEQFDTLVNNEIALSCSAGEREGIGGFTGQMGNSEGACKERNRERRFIHYFAVACKIQFTIR